MRQVELLAPPLLVLPAATNGLFPPSATQLCDCDGFATQSKSLSPAAEPAAPMPPCCGDCLIIVTGLAPGLLRFVELLFEEADVAGEAGLRLLEDGSGDEETRKENGDDDGDCHFLPTLLDEFQSLDAAPDVAVTVAIF